MLLLNANEEVPARWCLIDLIARWHSELEALGTGHQFRNGREGHGLAGDELTDLGLSSDHHARRGSRPGWSCRPNGCWLNTRLWCRNSVGRVDDFRRDADGGVNLSLPSANFFTWLLVCIHRRQQWRSGLGQRRHKGSSWIGCQQSFSCYAVGPRSLYGVEGLDQNCFRNLRGRSRGHSCGFRHWFRRGFGLTCQSLSIAVAGRRKATDGQIWRAGQSNSDCHRLRSPSSSGWNRNQAFRSHGQQAP